MIKFKLCKFLKKKLHLKHIYVVCAVDSSQNICLCLHVLSFLSLQLWFVSPFLLISLLYGIWKNHFKNQGLI